MSWSRLHAFFADTLGIQQPRPPRLAATVYVSNMPVPVYETSRGYVAQVPGRPSKPHATIREAVAEARYGSRAATRSTRSRTRPAAPLARPMRTFHPQSLIFPMARYSQLDAARWCKSKGLRYTKVEPWGKHWRVRQWEPSDCVPGTFKTVAYGKGITAVFCHLKPAALRRLVRAAQVRRAA